MDYCFNDLAVAEVKAIIDKYEPGDTLIVRAGPYGTKWLLKKGEGNYEK